MPNAKLKCCNCKDRFKRESMTNLPAGNFCGQDCIVEYATNKGKKAVKKQIAAKKKKDNLEKKLFNINDVKKQL